MSSINDLITSTNSDYLGAQMPELLARSYGDLRTGRSLGNIWDINAFQTIKQGMDFARRSSTVASPPANFNEEQEKSANDFLQRRRSSTKNVGTIQPDLYRREGSVLTQKASSDTGAIGKIHLKIKYDSAKSDFLLSILEVTDVPASIGEYLVRVQLKPDLDKKKRESIKYSKKNEKAQRQDFKFPVTYEDLMDRNIQIQLMECGKIGPDIWCRNLNSDVPRTHQHQHHHQHYSLAWEDNKTETTLLLRAPTTTTTTTLSDPAERSRIPSIVGELTIIPQDIDPSAGVEIWADFERKSQEEHLGELLFSINYLPSVERLTITVHEAKELPKMDITGGSDPYVKVAIIQEGKVVKKRKTPIRKNTLNPVWNEPLNFSLPAKALRKCHVELTVMDHDLIGNDDEMGQLIVGKDSIDPKGQSLWQEFMQEKTTAAVWHKLHRVSEQNRRDSTIPVPDPGLS